jgi:hypothetical protein
MNGLTITSSRNAVTRTAELERLPDRYGSTQHLNSGYRRDKTDLR